MRYGWLLVIVELCGVSAALSATPSLPTFADRYGYTSCISTDTGNSVAAANFNGEGIPDLICTGLELFLGVGDGTIRIAHLHSTIGTLGSPQDLFALSAWPKPETGFAALGCAGWQRRVGRDSEYD
jgi:hypothetical protein